MAAVATGSICSLLLVASSHKLRTAFVTVGRRKFGLHNGAARHLLVEYYHNSRFKGLSYECTSLLVDIQGTAIIIAAVTFGVLHTDSRFACMLE